MRKQLVEFLKSELIGPDSYSIKKQENGEEILDMSPKERYATGILFPHKTDFNIASISELEIEEQQLDLFEEESDTEFDIHQGNIENEEDQLIEEDVTSLTNNYLPSAIGLSCFIKSPNNGLEVNISCGQYIENSIDGKKQYLRIPINCKLKISSDEIPLKPYEKKVFDLDKTHNLNLQLFIHNRTPQNHINDNKYFITFTVVNKNQPSGNGIEINKCFFQISFSISSTPHNDPIFLPYPNQNQFLKNHEDDLSMQFLYRNINAYAIGHGCAASWKEEINGECTQISTELLPAYEMKQIIPNQLSNITLSMVNFSKLANKNDTLITLNSLYIAYINWIKTQEKNLVNDVEPIWTQTANKHILSCTKSANRILEGIEILKNDNDAFEAFTLMNEAMILQQLHFNLKLQKWKINKSNELSIENNILPELNDIKTWPDYNEKKDQSSKFGKWYPFQIAFILLNIKSICDPCSTDRTIVDLIWFPTGGGKTEAYLGLTAFTIFFRKIKNFDDSGTTVLMRYTLRLLTAQQFQRASSLICACEYIRKREEEKLGYSKISIGLWVGKAVTPNDGNAASKILNDMNDGKTIENPFVILQCPWCGTQMGPVENDRQHRVKGYHRTSTPRSVQFICDNPNCFFSKSEFPLPIYVIDEDIYDYLPTLLISTVDKFALLPWYTEIKKIFGRKENYKTAPPDLIIQDELHLISGALGSVVGHFETIIQELCKQQYNENTIGPKIIASTATISRAKEQIHALYGCGIDKVSLFPAQGLEAGESFFARVDDKNPGRLYIGVHPSGQTSKITAQARVIASLLQGVKYIDVEDEKLRDAYWTLIQYFNSLRDLGTAATLVQSYYKDYLKSIRKRLDLLNEKNKVKIRKILNVIELTSRVPGFKIPFSLQALETNYLGTSETQPVDICLATNMLSVGVDIQRLGLMVVNGQPKTTSEYIQATSRVGRSKDAPGLIIVLFNPFRARDKSHFEQFHYYHSTIYSQVEPTSVTPYSSPVREKALHSLLITFIRYFGSNINSAYPRPFPKDTLVQEFKNVIEQRVKVIDPDELNETMRKVEERLEEWRIYNPAEYGTFGASENNSILMYPAGIVKDEEMMERAWATLSSMRNVDRSCEAHVISRYI